MTPDAPNDGAPPEPQPATSFYPTFGWGLDITQHCYDIHMHTDRICRGAWNAQEARPFVLAANRLARELVELLEQALPKDNQ